MPAKVEELFVLGCAMLGLESCRFVSWIGRLEECHEDGIVEIRSYRVIEARRFWVVLGDSLLSMR